MGITCGQSKAVTRTCSDLWAKTNSPDARTRCKVKHTDRLRGVLEVEACGECLGGGIAHREDVIDELLEELAAWSFLVGGIARLAGRHDFIKMKPSLGSNGRWK